MKKNKLLIIDDNVVNLNLMARNLKNKYEILISDNAKQGLLIAKNKLPDLIISDIMMPEMDGCQLCLELKKSELTREIPLIYVTALTEVNQIFGNINICGKDFVTKPINYCELEDKIEMNLLSEDIIFDAKTKIFVIDDNIINLELFKEYFSKFNLVTCCDRSDKAKEILLYDEFDIIFVDIEMPGMDGWNLFREICDLNIDTPVIALSAHNAPEYYKKAKALGFSGYIVKPFSFDTLQNIINTIICNKGQFFVLNDKNSLSIANWQLENNSVNGSGFYDFSSLMEFTEIGSEIYNQVLNDYQLCINRLENYCNQYMISEFDDFISELHRLSNLSVYLNSKNIVGKIRAIETGFRSKGFIESNLIKELIIHINLAKDNNLFNSKIP